MRRESVPNLPKRTSLEPCQTRSQEASMKQAARALAAIRGPRLRVGLPALVAGLAVTFILALPAAAADPSYKVHRLVSDQSGARRDDRLEPGQRLGPRRRPDARPGGSLTTAPTSRRCTTARAATLPLVVGVGGGPTGTVFNGTSDFVVSHDGDSGAAAVPVRQRRRHRSAAGTRTCPRARPRPSFVVADRSGVGAIYKGLAIWPRSGGAELPVRDRLPQRPRRCLRRHVHARSTGPAPSSTRASRRGYAPFGIQAIGRQASS